MLKVAYQESYRLSLTYRVGKMWSDRIQTVGILLGKTDHASLLQKSSVQNTDSLLATRLAQKCSLGTPSWQCFPSGEHLLVKWNPLTLFRSAINSSWYGHVCRRFTRSLWDPPAPLADKDWVRDFSQIQRPLTYWTFGALCAYLSRMALITSFYLWAISS